jgi:signal transduction histidine kinase
MTAPKDSRLRYQYDLLLIMLRLQIVLVSLGLVSNFIRLIWEPPVRGVVQIAIQIVILLGTWVAIRILKNGKLVLAAHLYLGLVLLLAAINTVTSPGQLLLIGVMLMALSGIITGFLEPLVNSWQWGILSIISYVGFLTLRNQIDDFALDLDQGQLKALYIIPPVLIVIYVYIGHRIGQFIAANFSSQQLISKKNAELYNTAIQEITERVMIETRLKEREQSAQELQDHLKTLHRMTLELSGLESLDDIYRRGVEYGLTEFGFDRLGLFRIDESGQTLLGTFGTDTDGELRDERDYRAPISGDPAQFWEGIALTKNQVALWIDAELLDYAKGIGRGWHARAILWDGPTMSGLLALDNLIHHRPPRDYETELISLFSSSLSHAISRKEAERSLRQREQSSREFQEHLKKLHYMTLELGALPTLDDIYKYAIEYGLHELGLDRMALFRLDETKQRMFGTYGTDTEGNVRAEHKYEMGVRDGSPPYFDEVLTSNDFVMIVENIDLRDMRNVVGQGWHARSVLMDGTQPIAILVADNYIHHRPPRPYERELISTFSATVAHAISRKEADLVLQRKEKSSSDLQHHLKTLHRMTIELSAFDELDDIYRRAVEYGLTEFEFDRLALFRMDDTRQLMLGTFGTGPDGTIRDERGFTAGVEDGPRPFWDKVVKGKGQVAIWEDVDLVDYNQAVGTGWNAMAALWDGADVIGILALDNFINHRPPRPYELELISLYSGTLAHLIRIQEAKNTLRQNEQSAREFQDHLKTLHRMTIELGQLDTIEDIFKRGVEYGRYEFGIDRLGLFLIDHHTEELVGMFGTGPDGTIRDERGFRTSIHGRAKQFLEEVVADKDQVAIWEDVELIDYDKVVGTGWNGMAALWSGNQTIGAVAFDNFLTHRPQRPYEHDLLRLYSSVLSHLVTRKRAEQSRLDYAMEHERVNVLQQFLADASHDLRTPLSVVQMNAYLLRSVDDEQQREHYLDIVDNQVERLKKLLEDMLSMSRLDSTSDFEFEWVDVVSLTRNITDQQGAMATRKNINVEFGQVATLPPIHIDRVQVGQAIRNILLNALHYTPAGGIVTISISREGEHAVVSVKDSGIGISDEHLPRIFERFYRSDIARSTETGGSGLGLSIAQKIIEGHRGEIRVESVVDVGSTFKILLPLNAAAADA